MTEKKSPYAVFTEMLRHESAKPLVARSQNYVKNFPSDLSRYDAADHVHKFLSQCEEWMFSECIVFAAEADEQGIIDASEGLEKLILCRLYDKAFRIDPTDEEEDAALQKHIDGLAWVENEHLGIPSIELSLWPRVIEELRRMDNYKAPADKLVCIVNACHVINDVLKRTQAEVGGNRPLSADDFLPLLIHAVMKANPKNFHSNVEFVAAFRHPSRLNGEYAYWITMLMSAKEFVKQAGPATLDVSPEEYTRQYEAALRAAGHKQKVLAYEAALEVAIAEAAEAEAVATPVADESASRQSAGSLVEVPGADCLAMTVEPEAEELERTLLDKPEVLVYQLPEDCPEGRHRAKHWKKVIWKGPCRVVAKGRDLAIKMIDATSGRLFAECVIPADECKNYVEPVLDSKQCFVLKIINGDKHAFIGLAFNVRSDATDFKQVLSDFETADKVRQAPSFDDAFLALSEKVLSASTTEGATGSTNSSLPSSGEVNLMSYEASQPVTSMQPQKHSRDDPFQGLDLSTQPEKLEPAPAMQQACSSQRSDPFAEFVDIMSVPDVRDARIPVPA